ncbi:accessory gene regulator B family protein [Paenibacillus athensensis]|uniref:Accessory gene regulator B n=1 Tax=Paenibacillus athensensis TaxID=1967502 RepID=A0A4Y8Q770_9BACL|nr:accessory gene regulator B family protein [Paenibacillus athensensis]MCD1257430.1 accessory gene regulator B family protein [Paenibacillus athensensis]
MRDPIDVVARRLSRVGWIRREMSEQLAEYRLAVGINMIGVILSTALLGAMWGKYGQAMVAMVCFFALRAFSGGFHFRSLTLCWAVTVALFVAIGFVELPLAATGAVNTAALLLVLWRAPRNVTGVPVYMYRYMKFFSGLIVGLNLIWLSDQAAVSFAAQALLLLPHERR